MSAKSTSKCPSCGTLGVPLDKTKLAKAVAKGNFTFTPQGLEYFKKQDWKIAKNPKVKEN